MSVFAASSSPQGGSRPEARRVISKLMEATPESVISRSAVTSAHNLSGQVAARPASSASAHATGDRFRHQHYQSMSTTTPSLLQRRVLDRSSHSSPQTGPGTGTGAPSSSSRNPRTGPGPATATRATPGTGLRTGGAQQLDTHCVVAIVESRTVGGEVGIACIDLHRPLLHISQFCDTSTYSRSMTKLGVFQPVEIIMPDTVCQNGKMTALYNLIADHFPDAHLSTVQRKYFNETRGTGLQFIQQLVLKELSTIEHEISSKYYCLSTTAALLKYIEFIQNTVYAPHSLQVVFNGAEATMMIDINSARGLELTVNLRDHKSPHCLFGLLNNTKTKNGARLLRANILQPPKDMDTIKLRQDCIAELLDDEAMFFNLQTTLARFPDVDRLINQLVIIPKQDTVKTSEQNTTNLIALRHSLELVPAFMDSLINCKTPLMTAYRSSLSDPRFSSIQEKIAAVVNDATVMAKDTQSMIAQRCFAVKSGINGLLDVARRTYTETIEDIYELTNQYSTTYNVAFHVQFNQQRGYYLSVKIEAGSPALPEDIFAQCVKKGKITTTTTKDLIKLNDRVNESLQEIYLMTGIVIKELLNNIRAEIGCMYRLGEAVSMLDMLVSLASLCTTSDDYVRPEFSDTLAIKAGRHPLLAKILSGSGKNGKVVTNDTYIPLSTNFQILTGANMSGKSTYLRQIALLQIMAQIGSFVPARYACFPIIDHLFTRIGCDDRIESNSSTFMLEMIETAYILQNVTDHSLIILDELGRGTSPLEGVGICHAICEQLLSTKAMTLFATHFMQLVRLETLYPNVENYHFTVKKVDAQVIYPHSLSRGHVDTSEEYGIDLAEQAGFPAETITRATELATMLKNRMKENEQRSPEAEHERLNLQLATKLMQLMYGTTLQSDALCSYLKHIRDEHLLKVAALDKSNG